MDHVLFCATASAALRTIEPMEELTFDYKYEEGGRTLECHCGAPNCRKWLY